jgi:hypothetical protein
MLGSGKEVRSLRGVELSERYSQNYEAWYIINQHLSNSDAQKMHFGSLELIVVHMPSWIWFELVDL